MTLLQVRQGNTLVTGFRQFRQNSNIKLLHV